MNSYANYIETIIGHEPENKLLEARTLYNQSFSTIPEMTYYKTLERMCKKGFLVHLTKGLYYRPKNTRFGTVPISEKDIVDHYIKDNQGIVVGYRLYNQKGLTTQISKRVEILSSAVPGKEKNIHNVYVMNISISLTPETIPIIETLEILQNYKSIEDVNNTALAAYMKEFAIEYSDEATIYVLKNRKYKKSTIAFLESFLNHFQVKNSLNQFLSSLSSYNIPDMKEFY